MAKRDMSKVIDLFSVTVENKPLKRMKQNGSKKQGPTNRKDIMMTKLAEGKFSEFDEKDWLQYFMLKASEHDIKYLNRNYAKDYAILKSIMNELSWSDLKLMIDFVWDSDQDIKSKHDLGVWILSKGWINTIYQNALLWEEGKYKPSKVQRNREWKVEASKKPVASKKETKSKDIEIGW